MQSIEYRQNILVRRNQSDAIPTVLGYLVNSCVKKDDQKLTDSTWTLSKLMTEELRLHLLIPGGKDCFVFNPDLINESASGALSGSATIEADGGNLTFEQCRHGLLQQECKAGAEDRKKSRIPQASFLSSQSLQDLSRECLPLEAQEPLPLSEHIEFISSGRHLILTGNTGTIKTHQALGQGVKVDSERLLVLFIMVLRMLTRISENRSEKSMSKREQCLENNDPTICDEFRDIACDKEGSALLFNHSSLMAAHKSMIRTNTLSYDRWYEIFRDPVLPVVMIDRLIGLAFIINMTNQRLSIKETCK